jgi:hypothetical protein
MRAVGALGTTRNSFCAEIQQRMECKSIPMIQSNQEQIRQSIGASNSNVPNLSFPAQQNGGSFVIDDGIAIESREPVTETRDRPHNLPKAHPEL